MTKPNDGGPAFPASREEVLYSHPAGQNVPETVRYSGLSKRDYFAAKAMRGMASKPRFYENNEAALAALEDNDG